MSTASERTIQALEQVVKETPVGTNLSLLHLLWALVSGAFLRSRGAVIPALALCGLARSEIQRSWQALRHGAWEINALIAQWRRYVFRLDAWQPHRYEGYQPVAADVTAFWRPRLQGWTGKFFHHLANRALCGVGLGVIVQVGQIDGQRLPLLKQIVTVADEQSESELRQALLSAAARDLGEQEVVIHDGGASIAEMQAAGIAHYVLRLALNCTARRAVLPPAQARGRPLEYGELVRPLARTWKERTLTATAPDFETQFEFEQRTIQVQGWCDVVRSDQKVADASETFTILGFSDPLYQQPLVLATNLSAQPHTVFCLYHDRWPVEQVPLAAKQMLGLQRQFVFAPACCLRLPQLALLAGNILTILAALLPPMPTGFWDRQPKKRQAAYAASWPKPIFPKITRLTPKFGKNSRLLTICPRALRRTAVANDTHKQRVTTDWAAMATTC
jgi:hypothetical protein